jgi:hypothetical protein
LLGDRY